jgi:hypothetical protein
MYYRLSLIETASGNEYAGHEYVAIHVLCATGWRRRLPRIVGVLLPDQG